MDLIDNDNCFHYYIFLFRLILYSLLGNYPFFVTYSSDSYNF